MKYETLQKSAQELFQKIEQKTFNYKQYKLENIAQAITDGLLLVSHDMKILWANQAFLEQCSKKMEDILGRQCYEVNHESLMACNDVLHPCPIIQLKKNNSSQTTVHVHYDEHGENIFVEVTVYPILDEEGKSIQYVLLYKNITEQKRAEEIMIKAHEKLESEVEKRTKDILVINEQLRYEIEVRKAVEEKLRMHQKRLRSLATQLSSMEAKDRKHLANVLHDRVGQSLAVAKIKLKGLEKSIPHAFLPTLGMITDLLEQSIQDTRSLTMELSPTILYELGLDAALDWLVEQFQKQHGISFSLKIDDDHKSESIHKDIAGILFQAVRELFINIVKHARATNVKLSLVKTHDKIQIIVEDNGVGFDLHQEDSSANKSMGFGLFNIRERLEEVKGSLEIHSEIGKGSKIVLVSPIQIESHSFDIEA
ncbi:MAG: PAS domain-containing protein [Candidatus Brocadiae bacterium]|nr:PAS domain-containing protein [Candidatus Brocadiia bacterium]